MVAIKLVSLLMALQSATAIQIPLNFDSLLKYISSNHGALPDNSHPHYLNLQQEDLPINLLQYRSEKVVRVQLSPEIRQFLIKPDNGITFNIWGKHPQWMDLQIDDKNLINLVKTFPNLSYRTIIEDLPQRIYETYPKNDDEDDGFETAMLELKSALQTMKIRNNEESVDKSFNKTSYRNYINDQFRATSEIFFKEYRPIASINAWLELVQQSYPEVISIETMAQTYEHRDFNVIHFSTPSSGISHDDKKTIVITGGVHAREWISISTALYILYQLLVEYNNQPESEILLALNFLVVPIANPDGYEYTWKNDRLWRKNRQETIHPRCFGIDIDHSYDFHWTKSSNWPCGEEYSGEEAFEAIESKIWDDYLNSTKESHKIYGYLDLHSYSQEILYPYAYSCSHQPRDEENLIELAYGISKTIRLVSGKNYNVLPACIDRDSDMIPALGAGSALDFMYNKRAYWAFQLKLRDTGSHGFLLPAKYIEQVGHEIFSGVKYFCSFIVNDDR
jgi:extracellular matrix protein 14